MKRIPIPCVTAILFFLLFIHQVNGQNCTLPVSGGTATANPTSLCAIQQFSITVAGSSTGTGLTYQWELSPDNSNWTTMTGFTNVSLSTTQSSTTWYRRKTICDAGGSNYSTSVQVTTTNFNSCYCTPTSANCATYSITNVSFSSINNASTCGTNGYTNYTSTVAAANVMQGSYLPITINVTNANNGRFVHCYIDYNQNGSFDTKEHTLIFPPTGNVYSSFIKVPFTAKLGVTRMRVFYNTGSTNTCFQEPNGEMEDYAINITQNTTSATGHVIYVKTNPVGSNSSGMSWANAKSDLRGAIGIATPGDTIKMGAGTYYSGFTQTNGIILQDSIFIFGGYPSTGNPTNADRNVSTQQTILSGQVSSTNTNTDFHVLYASSIKALVMDGFILQNGGHNFGSGSQATGGGILIENSTNIALRNCVFRNNSLYTYGSAFAVDNSSATFINCIVTKNNGYHNNIQIARNSQTIFTNLLAANNTGGWLMVADSSNVSFKNSTIAGNYNTSGLIWAATQSQVSMVNSIAYYNSVYNASWQTNSFDSSEVTLNSSTASFQYSETQTGNNGINMVFGAHPKFKDTSNVAGTDGFYFTADDGYTLTNPCSPGLNAGSNTLAAGITTDITGQQRIFATTVDLGAYELQQTPTTIPKVIYVNAAATGANNGSSWANAFTDLHKALQVCSDTIKVAAGTYKPWQSSTSSSHYWIENKRVIFGAYPSTGNPTNADRNYSLHLTKFDGGLSNGQREFNVMRGIGLDSTSVVDGLIFTNTGVENWSSEGAVVYRDCNNPVLSNCTFTGNQRRVFWGKNNKNPLFLKCKIDSNITSGTQYALDLVVLTKSQKTTFKNCSFQKNTLTTGTSTVGEYGKILWLDGTNAVFDSCSFVRNRGTVMVNTFSSPTVTNSNFFKNYAGDRTVDLNNQYSNPVFSKCIFTDTLATAKYGGIMNNYISNPVFTNCEFYNGRVDVYGGVAYNDSSLAKFNNCVFGNSINTFYNTKGSHIELTNCISYGSSYWYSAPAFMYNYRSSPVLKNCTVVYSRSGLTGLMFNEMGSNPQISNSIFWKNFRNITVDPNELTNRVEIKNLTNSVPVIQNSMFEVYDAGPTNTKNVDPRFKNFAHQVGPDSVWFTADDGLRLCDCSPALNSGNNSLATQTNDATGQPRIFGSIVDRGAYELQQTPAAVSRTSYVNASATGSNTGASWANAYTNLQSAITNPCTDSIKLASGIYKPALQARDSGFFVNRNLVMLGSYAAPTETRDVDAHPSILSGDIGIVNDTSDNSYGLMNAFYFDSLIIDGISFENMNRSQGGTYNYQRALDAEYLQQLSISNSRFYNNYSFSTGSGLFLMQIKKVNLHKIVFNGNKAATGAGFYYDFTGSGSQALDCVFDKNEASFQGGGVYAGLGGLSFVNCVFNGNRAMRGAGMCVDNNPDMLVTNCTFNENVSINGGSNGAGIYSVGYAWQGGGNGPHIGNCIFTGNSQENLPGQQGTYKDIYYPKFGSPPSNGQVELRIHHSAVTTLPVYFWGGVLLDPSTIVYKNKSNPIGPDGKWFTNDDGLQLAVCSDGVDDGDNASVTVPKDFAFNPRIVNSIVDFGSYEVTGQPIWAKLLSTANDSLTANKELTDSLGWTHYYKDCQYLMSIKKAGQNIGVVGDGTFELKIINSPGYGSGGGINLTTATYNTSGTSWRAMHRNWKIKSTNAVVDSILIRFPYTNVDFNDVAGSVTSLGQHAQLDFFKVNGTTNPFDLTIPTTNFFRYTNAAAPSKTTWAYSQQDSVHLADYYVQSFNAGGGGARLNSSLADLVISSQSLSVSSIASGGTITATFVEANISTTYAASAHKVSFYLSANNVLTPGSNGDILLGTYDLASLNASSNTGTLTKQLLIPCAVTGGNYFVFIVADGQNTVAEVNEYNNNASVALTVTAGGSTPATPTISATPGGAVCNGNPVTLTASSSGCTTCTYNWNTSASGSSITVSTPGIYIVTATNACGSTSASFNVVPGTPPPVTASASVSSVCVGTSFTLSATNANSYTWTGNGLSSTTGFTVTATPTQPGTLTYTVTGTTNGCSASQSVSVTVNPLPVISITPADTIICTGSSVTMTATGAGNYIWSPATGLNTTSSATVIATPTATTTYTATGSLNGCIGNKTRTITVTNSLSPSVTTNLTGCPGNNLMFTATPVNGGANPQYQWFVNNVQQGTGSSFNLNNATNGTQIYVRMTSSASCASPQTANSSTNTINCIVTAIPQVDGLEKFVVSPNPSNGLFLVTLKLQRMKTVGLLVTDVNGKAVYESKTSRTAGTHTIPVNLDAAAQGVYYLRTTIGNASFVEKLVIVR